MILGYLVPDWPGQTHAFFWREVRALRDLGHDVRLFSTRPCPPDQCFHDFAREAREQTRFLFPPTWTAISALVGPSRVAAVLRYVAALRESDAWGKARVLALSLCAADLARTMRAGGVEHLHVHSCASSAHLAAMAAMLSGVSYSLTLHGDLSVYGEDHRSKMRRAALVSVVTTPLRDQVLALDVVGADRVPVISMGVDTDRFSPPPSHHVGSAGGPLRIATVARLALTKGHRYALDAVARLGTDGMDVRYVIAGDGPERPDIEAAISARNLSGRVSLIGSIGEDQVLRLLRDSDVFLLPSFGLGEAAPVSVMEAMACGLSVVCTHIGGTPDMIADGVSGYLVPQRDSEAIAGRIADLIADPTSRRRMGMAARARAVERFDYRVTAREFASRLADVLPRKAGGRA